MNIGHDSTTSGELYDLAMRLSEEPELAPAFQRAGLDQNFSHDDYKGIVAARDKFAPNIRERPAGISNIFLAEALAKRLFSRKINSKTAAFEFLDDRIRRYPDSYSNLYDSILFISEIRQVVSNLNHSKFFVEFCERTKHIHNNPRNPRSIHYIYGETHFFALQQSRLYGLGGRGLDVIKNMLVSFLRNKWTRRVPNLDSQTVEVMLDNMNEFRIFKSGYNPRKG